MANNKNLPRPNIPKPGSQSQTSTNQQVSAGVNQTNQTNAQTQADDGSKKPPSNSAANFSRPQPPGQKLSGGLGQSTNNQTQVKASNPAGLDPNSPGGAPPQLNKQGQVINASNISASRQGPNYEQQPSNMGATTQAASNQKNQQSQQFAQQQQSINTQSQSKGSEQKSKQSVQPQATLQSNRQQGVNGLPSGQASSIQAPSSTQQQPGTNQSRNKSDQSGKQQPPTKAKKSGPQFAQPKSKLMKMLPFILGGIVVVGAVIFGITRILGNVGKDGANDQDVDQPESQQQAAAPQQQNITLTYWGLWEPSSVLEDVFSDFKEETGIRVQYQKEKPTDYRTRLQSQIASGQGPDVFRFHATWAKVLADELAPMPNSAMSTTEYKQAFYPVISEQLQVNGQVVGIPLMYDGLGLYYNKDILKTANEEVPSTWGELRVLAQKLTVNNDGTMERGGLAIGNTSNVEHFADILGLLIFQNGGDPSQPVSTEVQDAIKFYLNFDQGSPVFSTQLPNSTQAFARGEVAMMFAPSWRAHEVMNINPDLNFGISPVPKLSDAEYGWASYWAEGVSSESKNKEAAWQLLKYLSSKEVLRKLYSAQREIRAFGEIYPRQDMATEVDSEYVTPYLLDAPNAKSWYLCSYTHDQGANDRMIDYYRDAVNEGEQSQVDEDVLKTLGSGVKQVLNQYVAD